MKRILKRFLFPTIIIVLVILILVLLSLNGGMYDDLVTYTTYQLMFGANYKNTTVEFFNVNPVGVIAFVLLIAGAILSLIDFKYDKYILASLFCITSILIMILPISVNKTEVAKYLIEVIEANGDGYMMILAGPYVCASISLIIAIFSLFKKQFNSLFKISK